MSYHDQLLTEINTKLDALLAEGKQWEARWVAHAICGDHEEGLADADVEHRNFWEHCGYTETRAQVTKVINKRAGVKPETEKQQPFLPGFERLQNYYVVTRNGEDIGVPTPDLTDKELEAKAEEYRALGAGCYAHANEIDRYRRIRKREAAAKAKQTELEPEPA